MRTSFPHRLRCHSIRLVQNDREVHTEWPLVTTAMDLTMFAGVLSLRSSSSCSSPEVLFFFFFCGSSRPKPTPLFPGPSPAGFVASGFVASGFVSPSSPQSRHAKFPLPPAPPTSPPSPLASPAPTAEIHEATADIPGNGPAGNKPRFLSSFDPLLYVGGVFRKGRGGGDERAGGAGRGT